MRCFLLFKVLERRVRSGLTPAATSNSEGLMVVPLWGILMLIKQLPLEPIEQLLLVLH